MAEYYFTHGSSFAAEAATYEPASPVHSQPDADHGGWPKFATPQEEDAYTRGLTDGRRCAGLIKAWPEEPHQPSLLPIDVEGRTPRTPRHDGWLPERQRVLLDTLARTQSSPTPAAPPA
jgi:hypothetical protein